MVTIRSGMPEEIADFWSHIGPIVHGTGFLREMERPVSIKRSDMWWLYFIGHELAGFVSLRINLKSLEYRYDYVVAGARGNGVYRALYEERAEYARKTLRPVKVVTKSPAVAHLAQAEGLTPRRTCGRFVTYERPQA